MTCRLAIHRFTDDEREQRIRASFLPHFDASDLIAFMWRACGTCPDADRAVRYFCGICWNKIRGGRG